MVISCVDDEDELSVVVPEGTRKLPSDAPVAAQTAVVAESLVRPGARITPSTGVVLSLIDVATRALEDEIRRISQPRVQILERSAASTRRNEIVFWSAEDVAHAMKTKCSSPPKSPGFHRRAVGGDGASGCDWSAITTESAIAALASLGIHETDSVGDVVRFAPVAGRKCHYGDGLHAYNATVARSEPSRFWRRELLFSPNGQFSLSPHLLTDLLKSFDWTEEQRTEPHSVEITALATLMSSIGQAFSYDASKSRLWIKPLWLAVWLKTALDREYTRGRIFMHKPDDYAGIENDFAGFDRARSKKGIMGFASYLGLSDHVPSEYHRKTHNPGSFVIGLQLVTAKPQVGAYTDYMLGSSYHTPETYGANDATAVYDQLLVLPLGWVESV